MNSVMHSHSLSVQDQKPPVPIHIHAPQLFYPAYFCHTSVSHYWDVQFVQGAFSRRQALLEMGLVSIDDKDAVSSLDVVYVFRELSY